MYIDNMLSRLSRMSYSSGRGSPPPPPQQSPLVRLENVELSGTDPNASPYFIFFTNPSHVLGAEGHVPVSGCGKRVDDADEASESYIVPGNPGRLFGRSRSAEPKTLPSASADEQRAARKTSGAFKWSDPLLPLLRPHLANHADLSEMTLIISVYDYDALGFDVPMGTTLIPLGPHLDASRQEN